MNKTCIKIMAAAFAMLSFQSARALHAEYFWNNDPGIDRATSISVLDNDKDGYFDANIPTDNLPVGINLFGVRVRYTSTWSTTYTALVWNTPAEGTDVVAAEYFYDTDPGIGNAKPLPDLCGSSDELKTISIPTDGLEAGLHTLGIRVKGAFGWSATYTATVNIVDGDRLIITALEYCWNNEQEPGQGTPISVPQAQEIELDGVEIPFPEYDADEYKLNFRAQAGGNWYTVYSTKFTNVLPTAIALSADELEVKVTDTEALSAKVEPENALFTDVKWTSSAPNVASVDAAGKVTGITQGEAIITAGSVRYPDVKAVCRVTVTDDVSGIRLDKADSFDVTGTRGALLISNGSAMPALVYTISGECVKVCDGGSDVRVPLVAGIYIVKCGSRIVKAIVY